MPIMSVNIDRRIASFMALKEHINKIKPIAVLIQDVPQMKKTEFISNCATIADGYSIFTCDTECERKKRDIIKAENMILVRPDHKAEKLSSDNTQVDRDKRFKSTVLGIRLTLDSGKEVPLFSVYIRPNTTYNDAKMILDWISTSARDVDQSRTLVMGDFNSYSLDWAPARLGNLSFTFKYNRLKSARGKAVSRFMNLSKLLCLNRIDLGPTNVLQTKGHESYVDLAFVGMKACYNWNQLELIPLEGGTTHRILVAKHRMRGPEQFKFSHDISKLNSYHFARILDKLGPISTSWRDLRSEDQARWMNYMADKLYLTLHDLQKFTRVRRSVIDERFLGFTRRMRGVLKKLDHWRHEASKLSRVTSIRRRNLVRRLTFNPTMLKKRTKALLMVSRLKSAVMRSLALDVQLSTNPENHLVQLDADQDSLFTHDQQDGDRIKEIVSECQSADLSNNRDLERLMAIKFPPKARPVAEEMALLRQAHQIGPVRISIEEIEAAIKSISKNSYDGSEGVNFKVFLKSYEFIPSIIQAICKISFHIAATPKCCHTTLGRLIPKKEVNKFRILHLSSPLTALLERIALGRLQHSFERIGAYNVNQYAFTAGRDRNDLLARIIESVLRYRHGFKKGSRRNTHLIKLDIKEAFDSLNQSKLIDKLLSELNQDPIKFWVANYLLERKLTLEHGKLKSKSRQVCRGVPQGSSLGPILWNYAINRIDSGIGDDKKMELLVYADDIFLIYNGNIRGELNRGLERLRNNLMALDLELTLEKCKRLALVRGPQRTDMIVCEIGGTVIDDVDQMSILGVNLSSKFKLHTESFYEECDVRLSANIRILYNLARLNIIKTAKEWHTLVKLYITNTIFSSQYPLLAINKAARTACDQKIVDCLRLAFNWSTNTPAKLVMLLTNCEYSETVVRRWLEKKIATGNDHSTAYKFLLCELNGQSKDQLMETNPSPTIDISVSRYCDPTKLMREPYKWQPEFNWPVWFFIERAGRTVAAKMANWDTVMETRSGRHSTHPVVYYNTMALLYHLCDDPKVLGKDLLLASSSTLLKSLMNATTKDRKSIELREKLFNNRWTIFTGSDSQMNRLKSSRALKRILARSFSVMDLSIPNFHISTNKKNTTTCAPHIQREQSDYHTEMTRALCPDLDVWRRINPAYINTMDLLRLAGHFYTADGKFMTSNVPEGEMPIGCIDDDCKSANHVLLHRFFDCPRFAKQRGEFMKSTGKDMQHIDEILVNYNSRKKLLNFIKECAN